MSIENVIRAWKDPAYRASLSEAERAQLPDHPAGLIELTDAELEHVSGGAMPPSISACLPSLMCGTSSCK